MGTEGKHSCWLLLCPQMPVVSGGASSTFLYQEWRRVLELGREHKNLHYRYYVCMYICIYTHTCIYIHTYIHTHAHIYTNVVFLSVQLAAVDLNVLVGLAVVVN